MIGSYSESASKLPSGCFQQKVQALCGPPKSSPPPLSSRRLTSHFCSYPTALGTHRVRINSNREFETPVGESRKQRIPGAAGTQISVQAPPSSAHPGLRVGVVSAPGLPDAGQVLRHHSASLLPLPFSQALSLARKGMHLQGAHGSEGKTALLRRNSPLGPRRHSFI